MPTVTGPLNPEGPAVEPPPGVQSNFVNPANGNALMNAVTSIAFSITIISLILSTAGKLRWTFHIEDYLVLPALGATIVFQVFIYRISHSTGFFVQCWDLQLKDLAWHLFNIYIVTSMYNVTMILLKSAILVQWARIFAPGNRNSFFWTCYTVAAVNAVFYLVTILVDLLYCQPVQFHWDKFIPGGYCGDDDLLSPLSAAINVALDLAILFIPQKIIWGLKMTLKRKIGLSCCFLVGVLCIVSASIRLYFAVKSVHANNYPYDASHEILLGSLEITFAFLTYSFPGIPKAVTLILDRSRGSIDRLLHTSRGTWAALSRKFTPQSKAAASSYQFSDVHDRGLLPITKAGSSKRASSEQLDHAMLLKGLVGEDEGNKILRTTQFNISEGFVSDNSINTRYVRLQLHPWESPYDKPETHQA
ncbi:hypothetical protein F5Y14DRAFT_415136 [Nemania sp. NC0429]|nr:hypothetical protein F5Y14DRAFT_415136 [Nemania sp. NC0429]